MPSLKNKTTATTDALVGIWAVVVTAFVIAMLYLARDLLIPLALAALLTFLLAPLVTRIERWIGRIAAVLGVAALIFTGLGVGGWLLTRQLVDLATRLPEYKGNIISKMHAFKASKGGTIARLSETVEELKNELPGGQSPAAPPSGPETPKPPAAAATPATAPVPALAAPAKQLEPPISNPIELVRLIVAPLLGPLGMAALVVVLVIFMLLQREDLRGRLIRLIGQGHISATTRAMDEAGRRVSRYLLMQLLVNATYGAAIAIGLAFIGVPNALLWGAFGMVLRFIPYVGSWVAALFPTLLALAISPLWTLPLLTVALFVVVEIVLNNVMEPWLYGTHTGVSSVALILAAVVWTSLWGPLGLVLATPLTVCLVVMGRHIPRLAFLSVALGDEEPLTPAEDCYHRLLTPGERDELEFVDSFLKTNSLAALYDSVFVPVLASAESDARSEVLDDEQLRTLKQTLRDIVEDLGMHPPSPTTSAPVSEAGEPITPAPMPPPECGVYCLPARTDRDEIAGAMLAQLLRQCGFRAENAPAILVAGELIALVDKARVDVVCISVVPPSAVLHARYLCLKLRPVLPGKTIIVGLWGAAHDLTESTRRLRESGADHVVTTLADAVAKIAKRASTVID